MSFLTDARFAFRTYRKRFGVTLVAVLSIALGIGGTSAIFSVVYAVLLDPYPYKDPERILAPKFVNQRENTSRVWYTVADYLEIRRNSQTLTDAFLSENRLLVATDGLAEQVKAVAFSPNAFEFLGVPPIHGRGFSDRETDVAVLGYSFWRRRFQSDQAVVGKTIELDRRSYTILGVLPPRFTWGDGDVYIPLTLEAGSARVLPMMVRMKPGVGLEAVNAELQAMTERFAQRNPTAYPREFRMHVERLNDWVLGKFQGTLLILMTAVGFLLLIACGNVAILLLAQGSARRREMAVRMALGAGPGRLLRQLLTESVLLSAAGGALGVLLAWQSVPAVIALLPDYSVPHEAVIAVNGAVVLFTLVVSVVTGVLFGMAPALQLRKPEVREAMQRTSRTTGRIHGLLVMSEMALTIVLLVGAGIAIRGFLALTTTRTGYDGANVLTMRLNTREGTYDTWVKRLRFHQQVLERLRSTPGVQSATATTTAMPPWIGWNTVFERPGAPRRLTLVGLVGDEYFSTLRIPLLRGRVFTRGDVESGRPVAVINEEMARLLAQEVREPLGETIRLPELEFSGSAIAVSPPGKRQQLEIVGIVATARNRGLRDSPKPAVYIPDSLALPVNWAYLVRTSSEPHRLMNTLREQIRTVDPDLPVTEARTLEALLDRSERAYPRFSTTLFSLFAGVGMLLAATGLYSVLSFLVARRTQEVGIRIALGARQGDVVMLIAGMTLRLTLAGAAIGLLISAALSRVIASYVEGWNARDPIAFGAVIAVLLAVALAASWIPCRRAISIEPTTALRQE
jgi:predicted permease